MRNLIASFLLLCLPAYPSAATTGTANNVLNCGTGASITNLSAISISTWVKLTTIASNGLFVWKDTSNNGWTLETTSTTGLVFYFRTSGTRLQRVTSTLPSTGVLTNIISTWDGSLTATNIHIYINNTEASYSSSQNGTGTLDNDSTSSLCLMNGCSGTTPLNGSMEDTAIWNRVITADERQNLSKSFRSRIPLQIPSGLVAYWPIDDEPAGTSYGTAKDRSGNGNHCTATGTVSSNGGRLGIQGAQ